MTSRGSISSARRRRLMQRSLGLMRKRPSSSRASKGRWNMRAIERTSFAAVIALALVGCAHQAKEEPSKSLVHARELDQAVARSNISALVPAEVFEARSLLVNAEKEHRDNPQSNMEKHLASMASAKFEQAMAEAHRLRSENTLAQASRGGDHLAALEAERQARLKAEMDLKSAQQDVESAQKEAKSALERLESVATVRETEEGTVITLTGAVLFEVDKSELLPIAKERLKEVADALSESEGSIV